jgi:hypothetical protein
VSSPSALAMVSAATSSGPASPPSTLCNDHSKRGFDNNLCQTLQISCGCKKCIGVLSTVAPTNNPAAVLSWGANKQSSGVLSSREQYVRAPTHTKRTQYANIRWRVTPFHMVKFFETRVTVWDGPMVVRAAFRI